MVRKIISGGQTGVDRAALDIARSHDIPHGGWCPRGRRAEDGPIADSYMLSETPSADYAQRTEWNVRDSDGTLIITRGKVRGGTALTVELARRHDRPVAVCNLDDGAEDWESKVRRWIDDHGIHVLNVAGPRASEVEGIYDDAAQLLTAILDRPPSSQQAGGNPQS